MNDWHPIIDAVEGPTGAWHLVDAAGVRAGRIELRRVMNGAELRYRVEFRGEVIGWATSLRTACERLNQAHVRAHGPGGGSMADWGEATRRSGPAPGRASAPGGGSPSNPRPRARDPSPPRGGAHAREGGRPTGRPPPEV